MLNYKKAQVAETMTWIVATVIIVLALSFFLFFTNVLAKAGAIKKAVNNFLGRDYDLSNRIEVKTALAFSLNDSNRREIENWINMKK